MTTATSRRQPHPTLQHPKHKHSHGTVLLPLLCAVLLLRTVLLCSLPHQPAKLTHFFSLMSVSPSLYVLTHTLTFTCTCACCCDGTYGDQDHKISHAHSLILSLSMPVALGCTLTRPCCNAGHSARLADSPRMKQMPLLPWLRPAAVSSSPALQRGLCSLNRCSGSTEKLRSVHNQAAGTNGTRNRGVSAESGSESASPSESQDNSAEPTNRLNRRRRSRGKKPSAGVLEWSTEAGFIEGESESSADDLEGSGSLGEMASNEDLVHERFGTHHVELDSIQQISLLNKFQHENEANASLQQDSSGQSSDAQSGETSMGTREMQPTNIREREGRSDMRESYTPMVNVAIAVDDVIINDS